MSKEKKINNEMVILARESRGLTQKELAERLNITQGALSRIEAGLLNTDSGIDKLSKVLEYPVSFFTQKRQIYGLGLVEVFHRKRQSVGVKTLNKIYSLIDIRRNEISRLLRGVDIGTIDFPSFSLEDYSPSEIARMVRAQWRVPHGPVYNVTMLIEKARGIIIPFDFETSKIDGISYWLPSLPPLFFINRFIPSDRIRFTDCHEMGHIVMHQKAPTPEVEDQANEFAAEFLMPERDIKPFLVDLSVEKLASLKPYWKVSMSALLKRAIDLQAISPRHGRTLYMQLSKAGYRSQEPIILDPEQPTLLKELLKVYVDDMGYSGNELAKMINLHEEEFRSIYVDKSLGDSFVLNQVDNILKQHQN
jgi:Zn-dependent peptidase ImmA (M78 family)/transcriptional regulator with XRE-family HTH domain